MLLNGTRVLVTGGAKRVGAELVRAFSNAGAKVILHYHRSEKEALALFKEIGGETKHHQLVRFDLSDPETLPDFFRMIPSDLSVLINNASVFNRQGIAKESLADGRRQFDVNFWSPMVLTRLFFEHSTMPELSVVNILDQAIRTNAPENFSYSISKKALAEATRCAALQLAPRMRVNGIAPGPVFPPPGLEHLGMRKTLSTLPLKHPVDVHDLASAVLFAAGNSSMTGSVVFVDCGQSLL